LFFKGAKAVLYPNLIHYQLLRIPIISRLHRDEINTAYQALYAGIGIQFSRFYQTARQINYLIRATLGCPVVYRALGRIGIDLDRAVFCGGAVVVYANGLCHGKLMVKLSVLVR